MPNIKLTDQVGVEVKVELNENSAIARYMKNLSKLKLSKLQFDDLKNIPLDETPLQTLETGITFDQPTGLGVDDTELTIGAGVSGGLKLLSAKDEQLFDPEVFDDPITIRDDQVYLSAQATAKFSSELTTKNGDLNFGFTAGSQVSFASYRLFERPANGAFPSGLNALKETIAGFVIPGDLEDLVRMNKGTVATVEGSGTFKFSGGMNLLTVVNPLVAADLPEPIGTLKVASGGAIKVGASFEITGAYQLRVQKVSDDKIRLGYYRKKGTEFGVKASASLALSGGFGNFDSLGMLLKAISSDPQVDAEELKRGGLTDAQVESIEKVVEAGISRKLEIAAGFELSSQDISGAAFLFEVELAKLNDAGRSAVHQALHADLTGLAVATSDLPPGISLVRSIFSEVQKEKHTVKLNLLGIYNFISVSTLILNGTVMFEPRTGEIIITDKATASRIAASMFNFAADAEKLRKVLAESVLITAAYRCSKLVTHQPELQIVHSYMELHTKTNQTVMKDNLDVFESLGLMTKSEKEQLLGLSAQFGRTMLYTETSYDDRLVNDLFLKNGAPRRSEEYEAAGRQALALLVQSGEAEQFRRLPARDDILWNEMKQVGQPGFRFISKLKALTGSQLGAITSDYSVIVWWAESMEEMSTNLAAIRQFLSDHPASDPENSTFKSLRKKLASKLKEVASNTKSEFGDPWGLLAMDQCSGGRAAAKALVTSPQLSIFRQRS